jgi:ribosomal protein L37AE/L43A
LSRPNEQNRYHSPTVTLELLLHRLLLRDLYPYHHLRFSAPNHRKPQQMVFTMTTQTTECPHCGQRGICKECGLTIDECNKIALARIDGSPKPPPTPTEVIKRIAEIANAIGWQAAVGASETAGTIISVLAANPQIIDRFIADGAGAFIDGPIALDAANGCLTYYAQTGEILSPSELHKRRGISVVPKMVL